MNAPPNLRPPDDPPASLDIANRPSVVRPVSETADGILSIQRTIKVLAANFQVPLPECSENILNSYGGHVFHYQFETLDGIPAILDRLAGPTPPDIDVILLDLSAGRAGLDDLSLLVEQAPAIAVVALLTGLTDDLAPEILDRGAADYLVREELSASMLIRVIRTVVERRRLVSEVGRLKQNLAGSESVSRKMVNQLREEIAKRRQTEKLKDDFLNTASHELRSPLAVVQGVVDNLNDGIAGPLTDQQRHYVTMASRCIDRLSKIINNLLDMSRLESGRAKLYRERVGLAGMVRQVEQDFQILARERGISLKSDIPPDLADVHADEDMINRVLINLVSNALKFSARKVSITAREVEEQKVGQVTQKTLLSELVGIQITVTDDGPGIEPDLMKDLFNKYVQVHRPSDVRGQRGTGLGLAICKEIIELHQGKIWAESKSGKGTQFHFILPKFN